MDTSRYNHLHRAFRGISGKRNIATTDSGTVVLASPKSSAYTIYIEEITLTIETSAAQTVQFEDSLGSPTFVEKSDSAPGDNTLYIWRFGGGGRPLDEGETFDMTFSGAGLKGHVQWEGHQRKTS